MNPFSFGSHAATRGLANSGSWTLIRWVPMRHVIGCGECGWERGRGSWRHAIRSLARHRRAQHGSAR